LDDWGAIVFHLLGFPWQPFFVCGHALVEKPSLFCIFFQMFLKTSFRGEFEGLTVLTAKGGFGGFFLPYEPKRGELSVSSDWTILFSFLKTHKAPPPSDFRVPPTWVAAHFHHFPVNSGSSQTISLFPLTLFLILRAEF